MIKTRIIIAVLIGLLSAILCFTVPIEGAEDSIKEKNPVVSDGKLVKVHYTLTVEGKVVDSSRNRNPLEFQVGNHQIIPGFEKALKGMKVGEKKSFQVNPDEGYGQEDPRAIQEVSRDKLSPDLKLEAGMTLYAKGPNGQAIPVRVVEVKKDIVVINFNHPLAGKTLNFDVEIIEIN